MKFFLILLSCLVALTGASQAAQDIPNVIFDTDLSSDVDDVGAVAVLHTLATKGEVRILATVVSSGDPWSAPCLRALNAWYGRPNIPVAAVRGPSVVHESKYTRAIAEEDATTTAAVATADAVALYRQVLAGAPDNSVTIITVGYLTNLANLLQSGPDETSSLDGRQLLQHKVRMLVVMGGQFPHGREWNLFQDTAAARRVVSQWPGAIAFCGFELGNDVMTGAGVARLPQSHPLRRSYALYNRLSNRQSWDQVTVLYAIRGQKNGPLAPWFQQRCGRIEVAADGANSWQDGTDCTMAYIEKNISAPELAAQVEALMAGR